MTGSPVLGINFGNHDAAAALVANGRVLAAAAHRASGSGLPALCPSARRLPQSLPGWRCRSQLRSQCRRDRLGQVIQGVQGTEDVASVQPRPERPACPLRSRVARMRLVNAAFEVSPDDPQGLAEAIRRAAQGAVVHLVRDGQAVADIVPAAAQANKIACNGRALAIERRQAERFGAPTLADYRKVYETSGWPWPGDDAIRRDYLVADAC